MNFNLYSELAKLDELDVTPVVITQPYGNVRIVSPNPTGKHIIVQTPFGQWPFVVTDGNEYHYALYSISYDEIILEPTTVPEWCRQKVRDKLAKLGLT